VLVAHFTLTSGRNVNGNRRALDNRRMTIDDAAFLEDLVGSLEGSPDTPIGLMREHLDAAHFYLLGGMIDEYELTLQLAERLLPEIEDNALRSRINDFIGRQKSERQATAPASGGF